MDQLYKLKGFKDLLKRNDLVHLNDARNSVEKPGHLDIQAIIDKINLSNPESNQLQIVVDRSKQEVGKLIRLNSLHKRVLFIQHVLGNWQPTPRYATMTEQIEQVQRFLDLLDSQKITAY
jgi:hypothetical protein